MQHLLSRAVFVNRSPELTFVAYPGVLVEEAFSVFYYGLV